MRVNTVLDILDLLQQFSGEFSGLVLRVNGDLVVNIIVMNKFNGGDGHGSSGAEGFEDSLFLGESDKVFNTKVSFTDLEFTHFSGQSQDTVSDDTRQGETIDRGSNEFQFTIIVLQVEENVGSTDFSDLVISEPQNLVEALLLGFTRNHNSGTVVSSELVLTITTREGSDELLFSIESDWLEATGEIGADRGTQDVDLGGFGLTNTESVSHGDSGGTKVKGEIGNSGDPTLINSDKFLQAFQKFAFFEFWKGDSGARALESLHVSFGSEKSDFSIDTVEGLQTFEALDGIMEGGVEGINLKVSISADLGSSPSVLGVPINFKEMVRGAVSELEAGIELGKSLGGLGGFNNEILLVERARRETSEVVLAQ